MLWIGKKSPQFQLILKTEVWVHILSWRLIAVENNKNNILRTSGFDSWFRWNR